MNGPLCAATAALSTYGSPEILHAGQEQAAANFSEKINGQMDRSFALPPTLRKYN